jgi:hypothetical protein
MVAGLHPLMPRRSRFLLPALAIMGLFQACHGAAAAPVGRPVLVQSQDLQNRYVVSFFVEQVTGPPIQSVLRSDFNLPKPAVIESAYADCGGKVRGFLLAMDGGPLGVNGVTGAGATPDVGLVVGVNPAFLDNLVSLESVTKANGDTYLPTTPIGIPVAGKFAFTVFPDPAFGASCFVSLVMQSLQ